ncbi:hypothetical protein AB2L28_12015 [Kineococcus sp. TBRC 1896]|uniref:Uncharacterized protein n=1 Tax=Kineococcus mangrovi TaxID=1660183 RepID=A0ABV4I5H0_9ACTN
MSSPNPSEEPTAVVDGAPDAAGGARHLDPRTLRTALAALAGIAVIGGGALGFAWLGTAPSGAAAVTVGTVPLPAVTSAPSGTATNSAFSVAGRDIFAPTVAPRDGVSSSGLTVEDAPDTVDAVVTGNPTAQTAGGTGSLTSSGSVASTGTGAATVKPSASTSGTPTGSPSSSATPLPTTSPVSTAPSASTAPGWEVAAYTYTGVPAEGKTGNFVVATTSGHGGYTTTLLDGQKLYPAAITFRGDVGGSAWISSDRGVPQGWLVPSGQDVPAAALGKTTGTVRVVGLLNDSVYFVQVDRRPSLKVKVGDAIEGTPFTLEKPLLAGVTLPTEAVVFKDGSGVSYYGAGGAGETDGVSF